jgi:hypothetical protein
VHLVGFYSLLSSLLHGTMNLKSILNMLHTVRFSLQNAVYFILLPFFFSALITFYIQSVLKFKCKTLVPKG